MKALRFGGIAIVAGLLLNGCDNTTIERERTELNGNPRPANILLSDPQVFTRESLLNDRRREDAFLRRQLDLSENVEFKAQVLENLAQVSAVSARLGISFDPVAKLKFDQQSEIFDLSREIQITQLEGQLLAVRRQLQQLRDSDATDFDGPQNPDDTLPNAPAPIDNTALRARLNQLISDTRSLLGTLRQQDTSPRESGVSAAPEDAFEDRLAFRHRIRGAIEANRLDDTHDAGGRALYRLQFRATLLPEEDVKQYGVAVAKILPPKLTRGDVDRLFWNWMAHINDRMNVIGPDGRLVAPSRLYNQLATATQMFSVVPLKIGDHVVRIATPPRFKRFLTGVFESDEDALGIYIETLRRINDRELGQTQLEDCALESVPTGLQNPQGTDVTLAQIVPAAQLLIELAPSIQAAALILADRGDLPSAEQERALSALNDYDDAYARAFYLLDGLHVRNPDCSRLGSSGALLKAAQHAPPEFCAALSGKTCPWDLSPPGSEAVVVPMGKPYAYQATPSTRAQRVSSVASAVAAVEMALAASAGIPSAGVGIDAGLDAARQAATRIDTIERMPQVVGFAGQQDVETEASTPQNPQTAPTQVFGWVFGPRVQLNDSADRLEVAHTLANHDIAADVSVPAWWGAIKLQVYLRWAGNWATGKGVVGADVLGGNQSREVMVDLPVSRAGLDALSDQLIRRSLRQGLQFASIDTVEPSRLSPCDGRQYLLVYGLGLWRSPEAYLGGRHIPSGDIRILPDMSGLAIEVDASHYRRRGAAQLVIHTSRGRAAETIGIERKGPCGAPGTGQGRIVTTRLVGAKGDIEVELDRFPVAADMPLRLAIRPLVESEAPKKVPVLSKPEPTGKGARSLVASWENLNNETVFKSLKTGALLEVGVLRAWKDGQGNQVEPEFLPGVVVYIKAPTDRTIPPENGEFPGIGSVALSSPAWLATAYPDFPMETEITGTVASVPGLSVKGGIADDAARTGQRWRLNLRLEQVPGQPVVQDPAAAAKGKTITLKFEDGEATDFTIGTFKLK